MKLSLYLMACAALFAVMGCSRNDRLATFATTVRDGTITKAATARAHDALFSLPKDERPNAPPRVDSPETPTVADAEPTTTPTPVIVIYTPTPAPEAPPPVP